MEFQLASQTPYPNGADLLQNHKGDLWIYFASRLYDEERNEKRFTLFSRKTLIFLLSKWNNADKRIFPIHQQV
jgi:hypothetical protein